MAYDRYVTEFSDNENRTYGVMDAEAREEVSNLKSALTYRVDTELSYFDSTKLQTGKVVTDTGNVTSISGWACTGLIPAEFGDIVSFAYGNSNPVTEIPPIVCYDKNYSFLGYYYKGGSGTGAGELTITNANTAFIRYNVAKTSLLPYENQYLRITTNKAFIALKELYEGAKCIDYFSSNLLVDGKFINVDGTIGSASGYAYLSKFVPVHKGDIVLFPTDFSNGDLPAIILYDNHYNVVGSFISPTKNNGANELNYFYVVNNNSAAFVRYNVVPSASFAYNRQYLKILSLSPAAEDTNNVFYVGSTREGDNAFNTIKELTEYIETSNTRNATIYFDPEEFSIDTEFGTTYLDSYKYLASGKYPGPRFGFDNHYIFAEGSKITFTYSGENDDVYFYFSPVNIVGNCVIENATIVAENCRYCVHDDLPTSGVEYIGIPYTVEYRNCNMEHKGNSNVGGGGAPICIGGGCNKNTRHIVNGGIYKSYYTGIPVQISYHNYNKNTYGQGASTVIIRNVRTNQGVGFNRFSNSHVDMIVNGCYLPNGIIGSSSYFTVYDWNNVSN